MNYKMQNWLYMVQEDPISGQLFHLQLKRINGIASSSTRTKTNIGVPQGSVLGLSLFNDVMILENTKTDETFDTSTDDTFSA